jgi:NinB protein
MNGHAFILRTNADRTRASAAIMQAPAGSIVKVAAPSRTLDQNALFHAILSEVSAAKPGGRRLTPDMWKAMFMHACGYEGQFLNGLDGNPFPIGFRSSKLSKAQMRELIDWISAWCAENGVTLSHDERNAA